VEHCEKRPSAAIGSSDWFGICCSLSPTVFMLCELAFPPCDLEAQIVNVRSFPLGEAIDLGPTIEGHSLPWKNELIGDFARLAASRRTTSISGGRQPPLEFNLCRSETAASRPLHALGVGHSVICLYDIWRPFRTGRSCSTRLPKARSAQR
jgi:hypothetical protein